MKADFQMNAVVSSTIAFTDANAASASAARDSMYSRLSLGLDLTAIFGTTFGDVTVSDVSRNNTDNPSKLSYGACCACTSCCVISHDMDA